MRKVGIQVSDGVDRLDGPVFTREMLANAVPRWWQLRRRRDARKLWRLTQRFMIAETQTSNHGPCFAFMEALDTDPYFVCSNCGFPRWKHG